MSALSGGFGGESVSALKRIDRFLGLITPIE